jgi:PIN domain nuclease of toxin-antitoxin system
VNLLLDTHVLIWWLEGSKRLGAQAREAMFASGVTLWISAATVWEIIIKSSAHRLKLPKPVEHIIPSLIEQGFRPLPIAIQHALALKNLPMHHADPFDRILVAQAQCEGLTLVTVGPAVLAYDVRTIDASQ